jgi:hypothetical protein
MTKARGAGLDALREKVARGSEITLVLGAGVSLGRGVPGWASLARTLASESGVALPEGFEAMHPQALPIAFELVLARLGARSFGDRVREALYRDLRPARGDTLAAIARGVRRQQAVVDRRLRRVITFNADDLLEHEANTRGSELSAPVVWPLAHEWSRPRKARGARGRAPIPVYHLHGFLPRSGSPLAARANAAGLVFTDAQYWASFAEPTSFPNRVMLGALHDSVCVFVGLSMTDLNVARWLGMRAHAMTESSPADRRAALDHHFWIRRRPDRKSAEAFVGPLLRERGVRAIDLPSWDAIGPLLNELLG